MAPSATGTQPVPQKLKRLVPSSIQVNGTHSSPSPPLISASHPQSSGKSSFNSTGNNFAGNSSPSTRSASCRRDASVLDVCHDPRNNGIGLQSGGSAGELGFFTSNKLQAYFKTDEYILKKYRNNTPSLVIHLHPTHFRFDNQEGHFPYQSPMRVMIENLRQRTIPHDLVEYFGDIPYYEDCLIVQVHDHQSIASCQPKERETPPEPNQVLFSIHNYSQYCTPSPYVPYRAQNPLPAKSKISLEKTNNEVTEQQGKQTVLSPNISDATPPKPKILTVVLHPTSLSKFVDLALKAAEALCTDFKPNFQSEVNGSLSANIPPNPKTLAALSSIPHSSMAPPAKRLKKSKIHIGSNEIYNLEAHITLATNGPLFLEPVSSAYGSAVLLEHLADPMYREDPPAPKVRKRTVAEMAADQAFAAEQERYMLLLNERLSSNASAAPGGIKSAGPDGQSGGILFEARFERFKLLESIRSQLEENKRIEKQKIAENEKKQNQELERAKLKEEAEKRAELERKVALQLKQAQAQQQAENKRNRQILAEQARSHLSTQSSQNQTSAPHSQPPNIQSQHSHAQQSQPESFKTQKSQPGSFSAQHTQIQEPQAQQSQIQESEANQPQTQEPQVQESQISESKVQQPHAQQSHAQQSHTQQSHAQQSHAQQPHAQQSHAQQSHINHSLSQQSQFQHGHPQNEINTGALTGQPQRYHQQASQGQLSSPTTRTGTPQDSSSPTLNPVCAIPMQNSTSSMGGSPRPGSVMQQSHQQQLAPSSQGMTSQRSQQSHTSTPRILSATPGQTTPIIRSVSRTPRMSQATPLQGQIAQPAQQSKAQPINAQAQSLQQQRVQQMMRQQQAVAQGLGVMMQGHQHSPQQIMQAQPMLRNQQQQLQGYPAQLAALTQRQASQGGMPTVMNQNFMGNMTGISNSHQNLPLNLQQLHQLQQQQMIRQAHAQQMAAQQQSSHAHHQQGGINQAAQNQIIGLAQRIYLLEKNNFISQNPNIMISEEMDRQMKIQAQNTAQQQFAYARRRQQMVAAAQAAQQNGIQHNMSGIQHQHQMGM